MWLAPVMLVVILFAYLDLDILFHIATFGRSHEGWFIDETAVVVVLVIVLWLVRRTLQLRREIKLRREAETSAALNARYDVVTGMPNRLVFQEAVEKAIQSLSAGSTFAVMLVDVKGFQDVVDLHGYATADALRQNSSERFNGVLKRAVVRARIDGDEFAVLMEENISRDVLAFKANRIIEGIRKPFYICGTEVHLSATVGIAIAPHEGKDAASLMQAASMALSRAKQDGREGVRFFEQGIDAAARERAALRGELPTAIADGQIIPFYQPIIDFRLNRAVGFEMLARWKHPTRGLLSPDKFIALTEDLNLLPAMTLSMLRQAITDMTTWPAAYRIAINVSPAQLQDEQGIAELIAAVVASGVAPSRFEIELTEDALIENVTAVRRSIGAIRSAGLTLAIDDFGTGYSSFHHLFEIPFTKLKLDQSFVRALNGSDRRERYARALISFALSLDLEVTAEGIESVQVAEKLRGYGCTYGQGYIYSRPVCGSQVLETADRLLATLQSQAQVTECMTLEHSTLLALEHQAGLWCSHEGPPNCRPASPNRTRLTR